MSAKIFDDIACSLGEGPLWHPALGQLFWFDINKMRLYARADETTNRWQFDEPVSAAGWVSHSELLIASASALSRFDLTTGTCEQVTPLEADNPVTRSNDGRADPWGGLWIGTMGRKLEKDAGAIYRYYKGELRQLYAPITIPNATCFSPDGLWAYFADTGLKRLWRQALDEATGWPKGDPEVLLDFSTHGLNPDGAVADAGGNLWVAQWGAYRIGVYQPDGRFLTSIDLPASQITCPAFGGPELKTLFATSAAENLSDMALASQPHAGKTFVSRVSARGQAEHQVVL